MGYNFNPFTGNLDEVSASGGSTTPGGSTTQFQYNNAGAFGGLSTFTTDGTNITLTGRFISSLNGAASAPPGTFTGTWFTGGSATTTKPQVLIEPTGATSTAWSTAGTGFGVNAASGFAGNLLDLQVNGTSQTVVGSTGLVQTNLDVYARGILTNTGLGSSDWANWIGSHGNQLKDSAILSWTSGVATLTADVILRRDAANTLAQRNGTNAQTSRVYNTYTSATNYELGKLEWSSNVFRIGTEKGSGGGTARNVELQVDGTTKLTIDSAGDQLFTAYQYLTSTEVRVRGAGLFAWSSGAAGGPSDTRIGRGGASGVIYMDNASSGFNRLCWGGTTSSFPALKRNSAVLETKLADDSAYAQHAASVFQAATAHTVATLPGTPAVGMIARVTDATAPAVGVTVVGGGAAAALCWYNGAAWSVIGV